MPTPTIEEYLETIHAMASDDTEVIGARLSEALNVSPPTVTATLQRMLRDQLIEFGPHKEIRLTDKGRYAVESLLRRHRLAERLLVDILGMDWYLVHEEACRLEHAISPQVEARLVALLGDPDTCPHGNPIPGKNGAVAERRLSDACEGEQLTVVRIAQRAESEPGLLHYLSQRGLVPGATVKVLEIAPFNGPVVLAVGDNTVPLGRDLAAMLWTGPSPV
ncbi:MAG: metal-dependent transcriptional regulator [Chloroflexota bacterium]